MCHEINQSELILTILYLLLKFAKQNSICMFCSCDTSPTQLIPLELPYQLSNIPLHANESVLPVLHFFKTQFSLAKSKLRVTDFTHKIKVNILGSLGLYEGNGK
jgi:hypothetical protein